MTAANSPAPGAPRIRSGTHRLSCEIRCHGIVVVVVNVGPRARWIADLGRR